MISIMNSPRTNTPNQLISCPPVKGDDIVLLQVDGRVCDVSNLVGKPHRQRSFSTLQNSIRHPVAQPSLAHHRRAKSLAEPSLYPSAMELRNLFDREEREQAQISLAANVLARRKGEQPSAASPKRGLGRTYSCTENTKSCLTPEQVKVLLDTEEQEEAKRDRRSTTHHNYIKSRSLGATGFSNHLIPTIPPSYHDDDSSLSSDDSFARDTTQCTNTSAAGTTTPPLSPKPGRHYIEVTPGHVVPMLGSDETWQALQHSNVRDVSCAACLHELWVMKQATIVCCPLCRMLSPVSVGSSSKQGYEPCLGLGVLQSSLPTDGDYPHMKSSSRLEHRFLQKPPPRRYASLYQDSDDDLGAASCHSTASRAA
jgi:hypothetical protein